MGGRVGKRLLAILLFACSTGWSAVALNNVSAPDRQAGGSYSGSHSVTAGGSNIVAFAAINWDGTAIGAVTAITYGGQAMTSCGAASTAGTSGGAALQWFYLANPPTGSNTLAVTVSNSPTEIYATMISFTGVDQATPVRSGTYQMTTSSTTPGTTFTAAINSDASDLTVTAIADDTGIVSTNQTQEWSNTTGVMEQYGDMATTPASSVTHTWTFGGSSVSFVWAGFSVKDAGVTFTPAPYRTGLIINAPVTVR